jgi:GNAT superfamily N-acetyltransferase
MQLDMTFGKQKFIPKYMPSKAGGYQYREVEKLAEKIKWLDIFRRGYRGELHPFNLKWCDDRYRFIVIVIGGKDAGFVRLKNSTKRFSDRYSGEVWGISDAYIKPPYRHQGVLRDFLEELVNNYDVKSILLTEVRMLDNRTYYNKLGFSVPIKVDEGLYLLVQESFINALEFGLNTRTLH